MIDTTNIKILYHSVISELNKNYVLENGITKDEQNFVYLSEKPMGKHFKYTFKVIIPNNDNLYDWREIWNDGEDNKEYDDKNPYFVYMGDINIKNIQLM